MIKTTKEDRKSHANILITHRNEAPSDNFTYNLYKISIRRWKCTCIGFFASKYAVINVVSYIFTIEILVKQF